jgi:hypothetical protein
MSDERRHYESIRRNAERARERLAATLKQSRVATARDERTSDRRATADSSVTERGGKQNGTRFGKRRRRLGKDGEVEPDTSQSPDTEGRRGL